MKRIDPEPQTQQRQKRRLARPDTQAFVNFVQTCPDVLGQILAYVPERSRTALATTCRSLNHLIMGKEGETSKTLA